MQKERRRRAGARPRAAVLQRARRPEGPPRRDDDDVAQENLDRSPARIIEHPFFTTASFTGEVDAAAGVWKPTPTLREQYPRGLDGCWLVDEVAPERSREECDDDAADLDGFSA